MPLQKKVKRHTRTPSNASNYLEKVDDHYEVLDVTKTGTLRSFIEGKNKVFARKCAYYELANDNEEDVDSGKEVILMDEVRNQIYSIYMYPWSCIILLLVVDSSSCIDRMESCTEAKEHRERLVHQVLASKIQKIPGIPGFLFSPVVLATVSTFNRVLL